jgi:hypothetical protein
VGPSGLARAVSDDEIHVFPDDSFTIAAGSSHHSVIRSDTPKDGAFQHWMERRIPGSRSPGASE